MIKDMMKIASFIFFCLIGYSAVGKVVYAYREHEAHGASGWDHRSDSKILSFFWPIYIPYRVVSGVGSQVAKPFVTALSQEDK